MDFKDIAAIIVSYLIGCFNTGYYYVRLFHREDIREIGTKVTGAYNVSRIAGKKGFIITFLGDALKGALVVFLCRILKLEDPVMLLCILMVLLGHIFPFQLRFQGGRGLSTAFGAFLAFHPVVILYWLITSIICFMLIRRYTVTCLSALILLPVELFILDYPPVVILFFLLYMLTIIYACRDNLKDFLKERAYQGRRRKGE